MADGHQFLQQHIASPFYIQPTPKNLVTDQILLNNLLSRISPSPRPGSQPSDRESPGRSSQGMYNARHQPGPNSQLNGGPNAASRQMPLYNHPSNALHQYHPQHHQGIQPEHTGHGSSMGHASGYSSGVIPNASPYSSNTLPNGHPGTTRGGQAQQINEEWATQLRLHKDAERANSTMTEQHQGHYFARMKAAENRGIGPSIAAPTASNPNDGDDESAARRPHMVEKTDDRQEWFNMDMSGQGLRNLSIELFDSYAFLKELYLASNKITHVPSAFGKLRNLTLLELSHNQITEIPAELGMCTALKQLFLFDNQIRVLPFELGSLFQLEILGVEGNPLEHDMKQLLMENGTKSLIAYLREKAPGKQPGVDEILYAVQELILIILHSVPFPPRPREMVSIQHEVSPSLERVKILTWNILHEKYSTSNVYGYTPSEALAWEYRKQSILEEIRHRDADFVCLQEVSQDAMREVFSPELASNGYKGVQFSRTKAKVMFDKEANAVDGCAIFWKAKKYIQLDKQVIDFSTIAINRPDMKSHHDIFNRVMPKDNIGMICFFESRQTGARVIVANAHLAWEPELADVKLIQTAILMEHLTKHAEKYARWQPCRDKKFIQLAADGDDEEEVEPSPSQEYRNNTDIPLFVCGDYNSTKDSSVYELLSKGRIAPDDPDFGGRQYGSFTRDGIEHPFHLRSVYANLGGENEVPFTNYVPTYNGVIDYIWYSSNSLEVVSALGPPDMEHLKRVPGFPNYHFPSDHIHLMADVAIKARKDKKVLPEAEFSSR